MKKRKYIYLILVILWCAFIYILSDTPSKESNQTSKKIVETSAVETAKATNKIKLTNIDTKSTAWRKKVVEKWNYTIRKCAHGVIYFVLAILFYLFLISLGLDRKQAILWTIAFCFLYSTTDEIHQTFVFERTGRIVDCIIDTMGAILGSISIYGLVRKKNNEISNELIRIS